MGGICSGLSSRNIGLKTQIFLRLIPDAKPFNYPQKPRQIYDLFSLITRRQNLLGRRDH